ncbi:MAG: glutathione S-transferase N-terminal domain-containing protein [Proteobacteria bacterium]|nr:glutathione S-transferase N-terminal domain-containing protein [Pseudomonadota bacterium]
MNRILDVTTSIAATLARLGSGAQVGTLGARPEQPLELYEFEACPFCRKVREALSILDLEAVVYPCPKGGPRYREQLKARGGKAQFPYLVDPNTGKEMYESDDIVRYLFAQYGDGKVPALLAAGPITDLTAFLAGAPRPGFGARYQSANAPELSLELYSFEASPFCRIVREKLCTLELPYRLHNVAKGSPSRGDFVTRSGKMMVPYLVDQNTSVEMFESAEIVAYLDATYAA